ncbi:hypothetical protein H8E77_05405 [bacterium]|nr:hypothetical protein [bacterium]
MSKQQDNRKRKEIWGAAEDKLRGLVSDAVDVLETELKNGNLKAAIFVLFLQELSDWV